MKTSQKHEFVQSKSALGHALGLRMSGWLKMQTIVLVIGLACITGCGSGNTSTPTRYVEPAVLAEPPKPTESPFVEQADEELEADSACSGEATFGISLSEDACQVSQLLDRNAFVAAEKLLDNKLPYSPSDAGLYCQYVRLLIEREPIVERTRSPIMPERDVYAIIFPLRYAAALAVEFDPQTKSYLSNIILSGVYYHLKKRADAGDGYVHSVFELSSPVGGSKVNAAWIAIELDPLVAQLWEPKFAELVPQFVGSGEAVSSFWTANLVGDLKTGADPKSNLDFDLATKAFLDVLNSNKVVKTMMDEASHLYVSTFEKEIEISMGNINSLGHRLVLELETRNGNIALYEKLGYKKSIRTNSTSANQMINTAP